MTQITFDSKKHSYFAGETPLISVSQLLNFFHEEFDEGMISTMVARKRGIKPWQVRAEWKAKQKFGTVVHNLCEELIINKTVDNCSSEHEPYVKSAILFLKDRFSDKQIDEILSEKIMSDVDNNLAGTCDIIYIDHERKQICLFDWKVMDKMEKVSFGNKMMFKPIEYLPDTRYTKYSLQLSFYAYMAKLLYPDYEIQEF